MSDSLPIRSRFVEPKPLPSTFRIGGWLASIAGGLLALRLAYEQTILTWREGPQMVGFALGHRFPALLILGLLGNLGILFWLVAFLVIAVRRKISKRPRVPWSGWVQFLLLAGVIILQFIPDAVWERVTFQLAGPGPRAVHQMVEAAARGDREAVTAFLEKGVPLAARDAGGATALEGACNGHQLNMARYLISRGAELTKAPVCMMLPEFNHLPQVPGDTVTVDGPASSHLP